MVHPAGAPMSVTTALSAFANRGARRAQALQFLLYSALATVLVLLLSAWIVEQARLAEAQARDLYHYYNYDASPMPWSVLGIADVFCLFLLGIGAFVAPAGAVNASMLPQAGLWGRIMSGAWPCHKFAEPESPAPPAITPLVSVSFLLAMSAPLARAACGKLEARHAPLLSKPLAVI